MNVPHSSARFPTTPESILPFVLEVMERTPDPRLRSLLVSLSQHMHQFVIDNQVTEKEFERAVAFLIGIGKATGETKNEVILAFDLFGVSTLVAMLNNPPGQEDESSKAGLLGPFWRANAPVCQPGDNIVRSDTPGITMEVRGVVYDAHGQPLANAKVDVWQASPVGLYENQDPHQADMNLRGDSMLSTYSSTARVRASLASQSSMSPKSIAPDDSFARR